MAGMAKKILGTVTTANTIENGGGLSSLLVPVKANALGVALVLGGMTAFNTGKEVAKINNNRALGKVHWQGAAARLTSNYEKNGALKMTSGATAAMYRAAQSGNSQLAYEMVEQTLKGPDIGGAIETYGVTPKFVSALYGMGG